VRLSIVYAVRDPRYGGGLLRRMQVSMTTLAELASLCRLDYEVVVVEWNPPPQVARVRELLDVPPSARGRVRFIEVGPEAHSSRQPLASMLFCEYIGKNAGIRRSRGDWVLASTPDVVFNEALVRFLAGDRFRSNAYYRIDRCDVTGELPLEVPWRERLRLCDAATRSVQAWDGPRSVPGLRPVGSGGLLQALRRSAGLRRGSAARVDNSRLHTNASGDFLLMSRDNWFRLRGYTEICTHAHIDSIMCWTARTAGLDQVVLGGPMRLYHQEHDRSQHRLFPQTDLEAWRGKYEHSLRQGVPLICNDVAWGLADHVLHESVL
jgi:hypothetical protein